MQHKDNCKLCQSDVKRPHGPLLPQKRIHKKLKMSGTCVPVNGQKSGINMGVMIRETEDHRFIILVNKEQIVYEMKAGGTIKDKKAGKSKA